MSYSKVLGSQLSSKLTSPYKGLPWKLWVHRYRTRKQLKTLFSTDPERLIQDLGLHTVAVRRECKKWFWQA